MNVLLVIPPDKHLIHRESVIPLGIAYINGSLRKSGINVISYNLNYVDGNLYEFLAKIISEEHIDVLLCGGTSYNYWGLKTVFDFAKKIKKNIITIGGGAGYTSNPNLFAEMTNPDFVVLGEGEITTCELIHCIEQGRSPENILGIMYKTSSGYLRNQDRPLIADINSIAFPSYEGFGVDKLFEDLNDYDDSAHFDYESVENPRVLPMLFGRSCPYGCKFCFHTIGRKYRARSLDNFFEELELLIDKYGLSGITIMDEFFGVKQDVIFEFCDRIQKYNLKWFAELRVDIINDALVERMKETGCTNVLVGLESMDDDILLDMNKRISSEQSKIALEILYNHGINISGNFIAVTPKETLSSFYKSFDWWNRNRKYQIDFVHLQLCPGTEYYNGALNSGVICDERLFIEQGLPELNYSKLDNYEWDKVRRIIKLTRIDTVMHGKISILIKEGSDVRCILTCRHCNHKFEKIIGVKKGYEWKKYTYKCPICEHKSVYRLKDDSNIEFEREIFKQHIMNYEYGHYMSDWLTSKKYKKIILYGSGYNLILMRQEVEKAGLELIGVVYQDESQIKVYENSLYGNVISKEDLYECKDDVAVIICFTTEYNAIYQYLRNIGFSGKIDSMVNAILQHDYYIEENVW